MQAPIKRIGRFLSVDLTLGLLKLVSIDTPVANKQKSGRNNAYEIAKKILAGCQ